MTELHDDSILFTDGAPKADDPVKCVCKWEGKVKDLRAEEYKSSPQSWFRLAGREGWHYHCPRCGRLCKSYYYKIS